MDLLYLAVSKGHRVQFTSESADIDSFVELARAQLPNEIMTEGARIRTLS